MNEEPVPFFVVDRPASLRIIKGSGLQNYNIKIGLMGHANTSHHFQKLFNIFPCSNELSCDVVNSPCPYNMDLSKCADGQKIRDMTIKICDSGVFTKEGCMIDSYDSLFDIYRKIGTHYGIMIDYLKDRKKTVESAKSALESYAPYETDFKLIGVTQGNTCEEYLKCYEDLKDIGFDYIAVGGLLKKRENSARYVSVRDENFMYEVLKTIRKKYPDDWLYALGSYHPSRHVKFKELGVFGGDYKGWIFHYTPRDQKIEEIFTGLNEFESRTTSKELITSKRKYQEVSNKIQKIKEEKRNLYKYNENETKIRRLFNQIKKLEEERSQLFKDIIKKRKFIAKKTKNREYKNLFRKLESLLKIPSQKYRFDQVHNYLKERVYSKLEKRYLLILSCSQTKDHSPGLTSAIERYNGPNFTTIKKLMREGGDLRNVDIKIISAKYGLIDSKKRIGYYDLKMDNNRAHQLKDRVSSELSKLIIERNYEEVFVNVGATYKIALDGYCKKKPSFTKVKAAEGPIGVKRSQMKKWLKSII